MPDDRDERLGREITVEDFDATRQFLTKYVNVLTKAQDEQLGYALDSRCYGIPNFGDYVRGALAKLTLDDVNRAIKNYLQADNVKIVVVTKNATAFKASAPVMKKISAGAKPRPCRRSSVSAV